MEFHAIETTLASPRPWWRAPHGHRDGENAVIELQRRSTNHEHEPIEIDDHMGHHGGRGWDHGRGTIARCVRPAFGKRNRGQRTRGNPRC